MPYKSDNFALTVSLHYLVQTKTHKRAHSEVNFHSILLLSSKMNLFITSC